MTLGCCGVDEQMAGIVGFGVAGFVSSRYVEHTQRVPPRSARRRYQRKFSHVPEVRVVDLRATEATYHDGGDPRGEIAYTHRFRVRGHWRRLYDADGNVRGRVWVRSYLKGPEDAPLVEKDVVYHARR